MTEEQVRAVGPAFARYLGGFESYFDPRSVDHLRAYCRWLLSDLPRKSVEPIALAAGTAVRTLQEFLRTTSGTGMVSGTNSSAGWPPTGPRSAPRSGRSGSRMRPARGRRGPRPRASSGSTSGASGRLIPNLDDSLP